MCGIVGVNFKDGQAAMEAYTALLNLQHRGKEAARIVTADGRNYHQGGGKGEVAQVFPSVASLKELKGSLAVGQTRYSTTGGSIDQANLQPICGYFRGCPFYVVHNGNLVNLNSENVECKQSGASDTYLFVQKLMHSRRHDFIDAIIEVISGLRGSFCFIILFEGKLIAIKDRFGFCPLVIGKKNGGYIVASETCALDMVHATFERDVMPGELLVIAADSICTIQWTKNTELKFSVFEFIYFLRPDSIIFGVEAGLARQFTGRRLAKRHGVPAQMILPIPDSANELALGYFTEIVKTQPDIIYEPYGFFRSHSVGRTFIEPIHEDKKRAQRQKFNTRWPVFKNVDEIIILDDSLIRSNVMRGRIDDLGELAASRLAFFQNQAESFGSKHVHARIGSPPYSYGDYYGVDTYRHGEKLAIRSANGDVAKLAKQLGLATLAYADLYGDVIAGILDAQAYLGISGYFTPDSFYTGPFTGIYPDGIGVY